MATVDRTTFDKYVEFACRILRTERRTWGDTVADAMLRVYKQEPEKQRKVFLHSLLFLSEDYKVAWDSVNRIAQDLLGKRRRPPRELELWIRKVLDGTRPQPKARGRDLNANAPRDRAMVIAVLALLGKGLKATRNGGRRGKCSYEGESACDAVGIAVKRVYPKEPKHKQLKDKEREDTWPTYKNMERIWLDAVSNGITLEWPVPIIFRMPTLEFPDRLIRKTEKRNPD